MNLKHLTIIVILLFAVSVTTAFAYTGTLTSLDGLEGTGIWVTPQSDPNWFPATISWAVTWNPMGWYNYSYTFSVFKGEVSHFILQVSPDFTEADIFNASGDFEVKYIDTFGPSPGNPGIPGSIYGIKFDEAWGETFSVSFDSYRMPVWGDFYTKDGMVGGVMNAAWNKGFTNPDFDPLDPPGYGSIDNHILVPNGVVPEPSGILALSAGLMGISSMFYRRRK